MRASAEATAVAPRWEAAPAEPALAEQEVHVWRAQLDQLSDTLPNALTGEEHRRAARIIGRRQRWRWSRSRGLLRAVLALYVEQEPHELRLAADARGKPQLLSDLDDGQHSAPSSLQFSLSHSEDVVLLALSRPQAVGVDVEIERRELDYLALARRAFGEIETARLNDMEMRERRLEFLRMWSRREAKLKLQGPAGTSARPPWIINLNVGTSAGAALALSQAPLRLSCWECSPVASAPSSEDLDAYRLADRLASDDGCERSRDPVVLANLPHDAFGDSDRHVCRLVGAQVEGGAPDGRLLAGEG